jgi:F0F1-type ATP synthase membrane subunit b/b'
MKNWFKKNKSDQALSYGGNKRLTAEQKTAREEAKNLADLAAEQARTVAAEKAQKARDKSTRSSKENREKVVAEQKKKRTENNSTGKILRDIISGKFLTGDGVITHIPYLLFLCALFLANISLGYKFENIERDIMKTERALEEVTAEYKTLMSDLEARLQQSRVETAIKDLGLEQPMNPPILLEVNDDE